MTGGRLSEDIDLIAALSARREVAQRIEALLGRALLREHGRLRWETSLEKTRAVDVATLVTAAGLRLRVQLLPRDHYPSWPVERQLVHSHYRDVSPGELSVPNRAAFVAWKTAAWADRLAPRDLWDLDALAELGAFTEEAADLYRRLGPTGHVPGSWLFSKVPSEGRWNAALGAQTRLTISAERAAANVRDSWASFSA